MNINFINFIQEIKSAESNHSSNMLENTSNSQDLRCSKCNVLLNPSLTVIFSPDNEPGTSSQITTEPTRIYICPNPICTSITALESQRTMMENFQKGNATTSTLNTAATASILPKQTNTVQPQSSSLSDTSNIVKSNLSANQIIFSISSDEEIIDVVTVDS